MGFTGWLPIVVTPIALGAIVGGSYLMYDSVRRFIAPAIGAAIADNRGPLHAEYHFTGELNGQRVSYSEQNKRSIVHPGYLGLLRVLGGNSIGYEWVDLNNNHRVDKGDIVTLINGNATTRMRVDPANPGIEKIVGQLQPKIDAMLERILRQNTAAFGE